MAGERAGEQRGTSVLDASVAEMGEVRKGSGTEGVGDTGRQEGGGGTGWVLQSLVRLKEDASISSPTAM
jgi:hypothetical protein